MKKYALLLILLLLGSHSFSQSTKESLEGRKKVLLHYFNIDPLAGEHGRYMHLTYIDELHLPPLVAFVTKDGYLFLKATYSGDSSISHDRIAVSCGLKSLETKPLPENGNLFQTEKKEEKFVEISTYNPMYFGDIPELISQCPEREIQLRFKGKTGLQSDTILKFTAIQAIKDALELSNVLTELRTFNKKKYH